MPLDDRPRNRETEAAAGSARCASGIHLIEPVEDVWQVFGGDAHAVVGDHDCGSLGSKPCLQFDQAAIRRVADRIGDEIVHHLFEPIGIAEELIRFIVDRGGKLHAAQLRFSLVPFNDVTKQS